MRVYGWDDTGVARGELLSTIASNDMVYNHPEQLLGELDWERVETRFSTAKKALIAEMEKAGSDPDLIRLVRATRASDLPDIFSHDGSDE